METVYAYAVQHGKPDKRLGALDHKVTGRHGLAIVELTPHLKYFTYLMNHYYSLLQFLDLKYIDIVSIENEYFFQVHTSAEFCENEIFCLSMVRLLLAN